VVAVVLAPAEAEEAAAPVVAAVVGGSESATAEEGVCRSIESAPPLSAALPLLAPLPLAPPPVSEVTSGGTCCCVVEDAAALDVAVAAAAPAAVPPAAPTSPCLASLEAGLVPLLPLLPLSGGTPCDTRDGAGKTQIEIKVRPPTRPHWNKGTAVPSWARWQPSSVNKRIPWSQRPETQRRLHGRDTKVRANAKRDET
jgi:hypothetical protein